jgi:MarR family transcriptional regulator, temperature-dependent positive regulator of motility
VALTPPIEDLELQTLRALEGTGKHSQRELATALGLSLGKTNFLMRALLRRGWVKVNAFRSADNKRRYLYLLTPSGVAEKSRRVVSFLRIKEAEYHALQAEIESLRREAQLSSAAIRSRFDGQT